MTLKAPFPWFGGKSRCAEIVWARFGDVRNYIEPFAGSLAVLLARPTAPAIETVNDKDCHVANFWRAVRAEPEKVVDHCDWPVNEADLHARHRWLVMTMRVRAARMAVDPDYFDARVAGWWVWGLCQWIGGGWCTHGEWKERPALHSAGGVHAMGLKAQMPDTSGHSAGRGLHKQLPYIGAGGPGWGVGCIRRNLGDAATRGAEDTEMRLRRKMPDMCGRGLHQKAPEVAGDTHGKGVHAKRPALSGNSPYRGVLRLADQVPDLSGGWGSGTGVCRSGLGAEKREMLLRWFGDLQDRLRNVRVCCGDWSRICGSRSTTTKMGVTGVFLDPPYSAEAKRDGDLYGVEDDSVAHEVREWCVTNGGDPKMRIALCGYEGEHVMPASWECVPWHAAGGYAARNPNNDNKRRERIWFSPGCLQVEDLFSGQRADVALEISEESPAAPC